MSFKQASRRERKENSNEKETSHLLEIRGLSAYDTELLYGGSNLSCFRVPQFLHGSPKSLSSPSTSPQKDVLSAFADQIRLVRGHFGHYEPIDFLALFIGYAVSGERTLADFFERLSPF